MVLIHVIGRSGYIDTMYRFKVTSIGCLEDENGNVSEVTVHYKDGTNEVIEDIVSVEVL